MSKAHPQTTTVSTPALRSAVQIALGSEKSDLTADDGGATVRRFADNLFSEGLFPDEASALRFAILMRREASGEFLVGPLRSQLEATSKAIVAERARRAALADAERQQSAYDAAREEVARCKRSLENERGRLAELQDRVVNAAAGYCDQVATPFSVANPLQFVLRVVTERELQKLLKAEVIPELERRLAAAEAAAEAARNPSV